MKSYLAEISQNEVVLSKIGKIAFEYWEDIPSHYVNVNLDEFVIMPNHIHGLLWLMDEKSSVGAQNFEPLPRKSENKMHKFQRLIPKSLGSILRAYKASVKQWCNNNGLGNFQWQRNFYERVVRNERELNSVREYIINNPPKWREDEYYIQ
jgi:REP element-mobilizing transposase RayT